MNTGKMTKVTNKVIIKIIMQIINSISLISSNLLKIYKSTILNTLFKMSTIIYSLFSTAILL